MNERNPTPYLVTFKPVNRFFFGGIYSLGESFYAESQMFPQPTTILGCLRNAILTQEFPSVALDFQKIKDIIENDEVKNLTGTSTVNGLDDSNTDFGVIDRLSPVFLVKIGLEGNIDDFLFPSPFDVTKKVENNETKLINFGLQKIDSGKSYYSGREVGYVVRSCREKKQDFANYYGGKEFWNAYLNHDQLPHCEDYEEYRIFIPKINVGISRKNRVAEERKFYVKIDYSLSFGFQFGVIVWLNDTNRFKIEDDIVIMGGETSLFTMKLWPINQDILALQHPIINAIINNECSMSKIDDAEKIVALCPLIFKENDLTEIEKVTVHKIVPYYHVTKIINRIGGFKNTETIRAIPTGSVFTFNGNSSIKSSMTMPYTIGYNYVLKIKRR